VKASIGSKKHLEFSSEASRYVRIMLLSVNNGHAVVADMMRQGTEYEGDLGRYLKPIRVLPFEQCSDTGAGTRARRVPFARDSAGASGPQDRTTNHAHRKGTCPM
jgi:hypothetical protein